ncbi:hypothetical protein [Spiroplasma endosymbiont of Andrena trimmerana]|uniref:hypothetical protein n=1 Tax=Spiroplasma endosymbiont of Andrena trimmerana TaxID=3066316 RepID=UPI0030D31717
MKFLYENFLQFYLLALTSITQQILKTFDKYWTGEKTNQQINDDEQNLTTVLTKLINDNNLKINERLTIDEDKIAHLPSNQQWKDVAISQDRETIVYELKTNTHYRIFYDVNNKRSTGLIGKYPCLISEFYWIYTDGSSFNDLWINLPHWKDTTLSHLIIIINQHKISWKNNSNDGNFWKLQELQE